MNRAIAGAFAGSLLVVATLSIAPADATWASTGWQVGECYLLTQKQLDAELVPDATAVSCGEEHNAEVTFVGVTPVGTDSAKTASLSEHCAANDLYGALGMPIKKAITLQSGGSLTYLNRASWVSSDGTMLICATAPMWYSKKGMASFERTTGTLVEYLHSSSDTAPFAGSCLTNAMPGKQLSTSCDPARWEESPWVVWKIVNAEARFSGRYPGDLSLSQFAKNQCEVQAPQWAYTFPQASAWRSGANVINCYRRAST